MHDQRLAQAAAKLREAYRSGPVEPLGSWMGALDADLAYHIQEINTEFWIQAGRRVVGCKIGLTSDAIQRQLGVDQPDFGMLFADREYPSGATIDTLSLLQPRAEAEIAFVLKDDLAEPGITAESLIEAIDYVLPAIEIADSRIRDWKITLADTVADNASAGDYVLGQSRRDVSDLALGACTMELTRNGDVVSTGSGAACLGNPLNAVLWLARKMIEHRRPLAAGDLVLSGALGPMCAVRAGDRLETTISGLGSVQVTFD